MTKAEQLNATLRAQAPAAYAMLSNLGRELAFPDGVPMQSYEAAGCELRATIGQLTDGHGKALAPAALSEHIHGITDEEAFLYAHVAGLPRLRDLWGARLAEQAAGVVFSRPVVTAGISHALNTAAELFADSETDVLLPVPHWGNYRMVFGLRRGSPIHSWSFFDGQGRLGLDSLATALGRVQRKAILVLNFPSNPTGYSPLLEEVEPLIQLILAHPHPLVVLLDDAYHGWVYEDNALRDSLFWELTRRGDPERLLTVKADGATKELLYFGGRVGFLTFGLGGAAAEALIDKSMASIRGTVSTVSSVSQALARAALEDPALPQQIAERKALITGRYLALRRALEQSADVLHPLPFNSGFFAVARLNANFDAHTVRRQLIAEQSVGLIAVPEVNGLRIAFCSIREEEIPELFARVRRVLG